MVSRLHLIVALVLAIGWGLMVSVRPALWLGSAILPDVAVAPALQIGFYAQLMLCSLIPILCLLAALWPSRAVYMVLCGALLLLFADHIHRMQSFPVWMCLWSFSGCFGRDEDNTRLQTLVSASLILAGLEHLSPAYRTSVAPQWASHVANSIFFPCILWLLKVLPLGWVIGAVGSWRFPKWNALNALLSAIVLVLMLWSGQDGVNALFWGVLALLSAALSMGRKKGNIRVENLWVALPLLICAVWYGLTQNGNTLVFATSDGRWRSAYLTVEGYMYDRLPRTIQSELIKMKGHEKWSFPLQTLAQREWGCKPVSGLYFIKPYKDGLAAHADHPGDVFLIVVDHRDYRLIQD